MKKFTYPWGDLEGFLESSGISEVVLLAYGSLMNKSSAALTITDANDAEFIPAVGHGIKRIFDYRLPVESFARHGIPFSEQHIAALNVIHTGSVHDSVNGILVRIPNTEIESLRKREVAYDLVQIKADYWNSKRAITEPVFVLECKSSDATILPHLNYLEICENGALAISEAFLEYFRATTFLADQTRLADWNREIDA